MQTEFIRHFLAHTAAQAMHMLLEIDSFEFFHTFIQHRKFGSKDDNGFLAMNPLT